jgi:hypothetical protein
MFVVWGDFAFAGYSQGLSAPQWGEWAVRYPKDEASSEKPDLKEGNSESSAESWWWWWRWCFYLYVKSEVCGEWM